MKNLVIFCLLLNSFVAKAAPVMDTAVGTATDLLITVVPDDKDPNLYYFFPNHFGLGRDTNTKKQLFSYFERREGFWATRVAYVNTIFEASVSPNLSQKVLQIKQQNPNAKFTPIPIMKSGFVGHSVFNVLLSDVQCQKDGNEIGQQLACVWKVQGDDNCDSFKKALGRNALVQILDYNYSFIGMIQGKPNEFKHSIPVYISDLDAGTYFGH